MKLPLFAGLVVILFASCDDHDTWSWESDTNGPPAIMAEKNQCTDIHTWPDDNRTASPAYYKKKKKELQERIDKMNQNKTEE